ncbi:dynamin family protein [Candidatus Symbiobacter mobilis]|uniref:GTPase-like protein n=1 Tax=Candidatus Symbiobacter mobilis CR TaxID=946483 RepID=U5NAI2_9BURK|nr:dynamin family protein [Candidatus Symbiobacter mobilis]AGX87268.1 GTPase-like protein [Candidatus Symbiobacter mobilis CR]
MTTFPEEFERHSIWRREFALHLKLLAQWLEERDLLDPAVRERLSRLEAQIRVDKVMVAFVAEFSRGKSELINAMFFSEYGRRIMPASAGCTTMCPTEMAYDPDIPACLRLLPIDTRLQPQTLMEWRMVPEKWHRVDLDVNSPKQLAQALSMVAQSKKVTPEEARALGFWEGTGPNTGPVVDSSGKVEIPRWRHALFNFAHPLLKQGLVVLDTPGLNAIGAEPELTVNLIAQAQAIVFILGADTGVTQSDLSIWREHLIDEDHDPAARLVVLNKIDTLWDALDTREEVQEQIERQKARTTEILGIHEEQVYAVSAQKGLLAKVNDDPHLLHRSCLPMLEEALSRHIVTRRRRILSSTVHRSIVELRREIRRHIQIRLRDHNEQLLELSSLLGKNTPVIRAMRARVHQEQADFDAGGLKIHAVRSIHMKLLREIFALLGSQRLQAEMSEFTHALQQGGIKLGIRKIYGQTLERLRDNLRTVQDKDQEIRSMLEASFEQLNTDYGFSLRLPSPPNLDTYLHNLDAIERSHVKYLGPGNALRLIQDEFVTRLVRALTTRLLAVHEAALADIEAWSKSAASQLDMQLRERRKNFVRRLEAIDRIGHATEGLDERIHEVRMQLEALTQTQTKLEEFLDQLRFMTTLTRFGTQDSAPATVLSDL